MLFSPKRLRTPKIVQPNARVRKGWVVLWVGLLLVWSWFVFDFGRQQAGFDSTIATQEADKLQQKIEHLNQQIDQLRLQAASFERAGQVDRQAAEQAQQEFRQLQQEQARLKKEVAFLNGLLTDKTTSALLRVKNFRITRLSGETNYALSFTLVHLTKVGGLVEGDVTLEIVGTLNDKDKKLSLEEATREKQKSMKMRFKNFQKFEADLVFPKNYQPEAVIISTELKSKKIESLRETVDWVVSSPD
ncbi:MAG: hypothetical protein PVG66_13880 [Chromatiales bacterium]|jgi:hypothetical protein